MLVAPVDQAAVVVVAVVVALRTQAQAAMVASCFTTEIEENN
jgi:hypothetical protein